MSWFHDPKDLSPLAPPTEAEIKQVRISRAFDSVRKAEGLIKEHDSYRPNYRVGPDDCRQAIVYLQEAVQSFELAGL